MAELRLCRPENAQDFQELQRYLELRDCRPEEFFAQQGRQTIAWHEAGGLLPVLAAGLSAAALPHWSGDGRGGSLLATGSLASWQRLIDELRAEPATAELAENLAQAQACYHEPPYPLPLGDKLLRFHGGRSYLMGVVNVTPDSFSDGGRFASTAAAVAHGLQLVADGADLLDIGGESTRPGAAPVAAETEMARVVPVLAALRARTGVPLSVDTTKAAVADEACRAGAVLINDISGLRFDPLLAEVAVRHNAALCLMHSRHTPATMQQEVRYTDVLSEVYWELKAARDKAVAAGVPESRIVVDPGLGFSKTVEHNLALLRRLDEFRALGHGVLAGPSRKSFIGKISGAPVTERLPGTIAAVAVALDRGAQLVRVHDVREARQAQQVVQALRGGREQ